MNHNHLPLASLVLAAALVSMGGCDDQNVLYKSKSKETIEPVKGVSAAAMESMMQDAHAAAPDESVLPEPKIVEFTLSQAPEKIVERDVQGVRLAVPARYTSQAPTMSMRAAQFLVPNGDGEPGELVVFYFGRDQGGSVMGNAARWAGQFAAPEGADSPVVTFEQDPDVNAMKVTRLALAGTWSGGMSTGAKEGWGMDALIIEGGPNGALFLRLTGPVELVKHQEMPMDYLAANVKYSDFDSKPVTAAMPQASAFDDSLTTSSGLSLVQAPGLHFAVPADWKSVPPASRMRSLQFELPAHGAAAPPELVVFYFGPRGGGTTEDNLTRWAEQIKQPDGSPSMDKATVEHTEVRGLKVSSIYIEGNYQSDSMGMTGGDSEPKADYAFMGFIIEGGAEGPLYLKLTGPASAVRASRDDLGILLSTLAPMASEALPAYTT